MLSCLVVVRLLFLKLAMRWARCLKNILLSAMIDCLSSAPAPLDHLMTRLQVIMTYFNMYELSVRL